MSKKLQVVNEAQAPVQEGIFGAITPAMVYHFLRKNADPSNAGFEYAVPVALPGSETMFEDFFNAKMANGYFVKTYSPDVEDIVDAGVITSNACSPDIYVVTSFSAFGEYSKHPFASEGRAGRRLIHNKQLGLELDVTIEDILQFGCTWTPEQRKEVLTTTVRQHYEDMFPAKEVKALLAQEYALR